MIGADSNQRIMRVDGHSWFADCARRRPGTRSPPGAHIVDAETTVNVQADENPTLREVHEGRGPRIGNLTAFLGCPRAHVPKPASRVAISDVPQLEYVTPVPAERNRGDSSNRRQLSDLHVVDHAPDACLSAGCPARRP